MLLKIENLFIYKATRLPLTQLVFYLKRKNSFTSMQKNKRIFRFFLEFLFLRQGRLHHYLRQCYGRLNYGLCWKMENFSEHDQIDNENRVTLDSIMQFQAPTWMSRSK